MNGSADSIYLDHSATTPLREEVLEAMRPYLTEHFGNPGSLHHFGRECRVAIDHAREQVATLINADPREIIFTSGGTEADHLALRGVATAAPGQQLPKNLTVSAVEHHAVLHAAADLQRRGGVEMRLAPVNSGARVDPAELGSLIDERTVLVSVMHANNETGTVQPLEEIGRLCRDRGIPFHSDAVQSAGKIPVDVSAISADLLSLSAHKMGGPKGVGALFARREIALLPQIVGGAQERGRRAGTENVAGIVGFGKACALAREEMDRTAAQTGELRNRLERGILKSVGGARVNGSLEHRLPNVLNVALCGLEGERVMMELDTEKIATSTGSTCTSGAVDPSHVLLAMGQSHEKAHSAVRFSLGGSNTGEEIERALEVLGGVVARLREEASVVGKA